LKIQEITQTAKQLGRRINNLEDLDENTLQEMYYAIKEYAKNKNNSHVIDYMW